MKSTLTAADVLADIEFELMQGSISKDDLGQGIQTVRQHQSKLRRQTFDSGQDAIDWQDALSQQFQLNDMLLTLLQEMAGGVNEVRETAVWLGQKRRGEGERPLFNDTPINAEASLKPTDELTQTMHLNTIHQKPEITASSRPIPLLNGLLRRLRVGLHQLVLFYVNKLAKKQAHVNHTQADWILHLNATFRHQQEEIEHLTGLIKQLQEKVDRLEGDTAVE